MSTLPKDDPAAGMLGADSLLEEVTRTIVEEVGPRRIVLFGSRARGDARSDSDYDIMVEIDSELDSRRVRDAVCDLFPNGPRSMDILVYTSDEVRRWRDDVGFVLYDIVREGRVLYRRPDVADSGFGPGASSPASRVREAPSGAPESVSSWIDRAQNDFNAMQAAERWSPPPRDAVCFHAHQCAEKLLKACLIARSIRPARTHDLGELLTACVKAGFDLELLSADCDRLHKLWSKSRYPEDGEPTRTEAEAAASAATAVRSAILPLLQLD